MKKPPKRSPQKSKKPAAPAFPGFLERFDALVSDRTRSLRVGLVAGVVLGAGFFFTANAFAADAWHPLPAELKSAFKGTQIDSFRVENYEAFFRGSRLTTATNDKWQAPSKQSFTKSYKHFENLKFASASQKRCFDILASGGTECLSEQQVQKLAHSMKSDSDLLVETRLVARKYGLRIARDFVSEALGAQDDSLGTFERRVLETTRDRSKTFADSIAKLDASLKERTGIYFIAGYNHDRGVSADVMDAAAKHLRELGFKSERLIVSPAGSSEVNSAMVLETLEKAQASLDSIILVSLSKGSSDLSHFVINRLPKASQGLRDKTKVIVSLSGTLRDAMVPHWMATDRGPTSKIMRAYMKKFLPEDHREWDGLLSMGTDYWLRYQKPANIRSILFVSFPMLPESPRGQPEKKKELRLATRLVTPANSGYGPHDGLVETAASILPPSTGHKQWIIRAFGDHGLIDGVYVSGEPVSVDFVSTKDNVKAGVELIDAFARAFPSDILVGD
jgi:dihydroxyacetone kinase DhaKLM complex PTS-EIIA-like component DhaM